MRGTVCILFWVLSIIPALAEDPCATLKENYSAIGVAQCAQTGFDKSDRLLNETYVKVTAYLKNEGRDLKPLISAERAWIIERDARCNESAKELGLIDQTGDGLILDCKKKWTDARIEMLNNYIP